MYMNLSVLVPLFNDRLSVSDDNLLQKLLIMTLQSIEFIALFSALGILHISVSLQTHWLSGIVKDIKNCDFGVLDM